MAQKYLKTSLITGRTYDVFSTVKILNIQQVIRYLQLNVPLEDIEISTDRRTNNPVLVYIFDRDLSKEAYNIWCNRE